MATHLESLREIRQRTLALVEDFDEERMLGPRLAIVNPPRWEIGHVGWFQEYWILRHALGREPMLPNGDALYNSAIIAHDERWDAPLLSVAETRGYLDRVLDVVSDSSNEIIEEKQYFVTLALLHECMHAEAL